MPVTDLKSCSIFYGHPVLYLAQGGSSHVYRQTHFLAGHRSHANAYIPSMCATVQRQLSCKTFHLSRSVFLHGICPTHISGKSPRYRGVSSCPTKQTIPYGHSDKNFTQHAGRSQRKTRLAYLCRFCPIAYLHSSTIIHQRRFWSRTRSNRICPRFHHHRPQLVSIPMGSFSPSKSSNKTSYAIRPTRQYSHIHPYQRRQVARCQRPRRINTRTWQLLHHGSRLSGFFQAVFNESMVSLFRHQGQVKLPVPQTVFSSYRQENGPEMRSNNLTDRFLSLQGLSRKNQTHQISRCGNQQNASFSDKQLFITGINHYPAIQKPLEGRTVLQMDQATPANQIIFRHHRECRQNPGLDRSLSLRARSYYKKTAQSGHKPLHNSTNLERYHFRKNTVISTSYKFRIQS